MEWKGLQKCVKTKEGECDEKDRRVGREEGRQKWRLLQHRFIIKRIEYSKPIDGISRQELTALPFVPYEHSFLFSLLLFSPCPICLSVFSSSFFCCSKTFQSLRHNHFFYPFFIFKPNSMSTDQLVNSLSSWILLFSLNFLFFIFSL